MQQTHTQYTCLSLFLGQTRGEAAREGQAAREEQAARFLNENKVTRDTINNVHEDIPYFILTLVKNKSIRRSNHLQIKGKPLLVS